MPPNCQLPAAYLTAKPLNQLAVRPLSQPTVKPLSQLTIKLLNRPSRLLPELCCIHIPKRLKGRKANSSGSRTVKRKQAAGKDEKAVVCSMTG